MKVEFKDITFDTIKTFHKVKCTFKFKRTKDDIHKGMFWVGRDEHSDNNILKLFIVHEVANYLSGNNICEFRGINEEKDLCSNYGFKYSYQVMTRNSKYLESHIESSACEMYDIITVGGIGMDNVNISIAKPKLKINFSI